MSEEAAIFALSLSRSSLSFFPFAPFVFSLVFLIDCLKQTWFSLLCNFLFTSSIWVAFQCNIHKQQTLYSHRYVNFTFVLVRESEGVQKAVPSLVPRSSRGIITAYNCLAVKAPSILDYAYRLVREGFILKSSEIERKRKRKTILIRQQFWWQLLPGSSHG